MHAPLRRGLTLQNVMKTFMTPEGPVNAVDSVNITLEGSEFFTMLGPSGCGKTTTLRMIAGLETPSSGQIMFDGRDLSRSSAFARNIGMVFQSYALFPHLTLFENVAYGLRVRKMPEAEVRRRVERTIALLGLSGMAGRHPADLSGGQQQRVSIARALVYEPAMLLLDEPLANLDAKLRVEMREEIRRLQKQLGILLIYVTHDQEEAMSVSDRIAVFDRGRLQQLGSPQEIYAEPANAMVAGFVGRGSLLKGKVVEGQVEIAGHRLAARGRLPAGGDVNLLLRPEALAPAEKGIPVTVADVTYKGPVYEVTVAIAGGGSLDFDLALPPDIGRSLRIGVADAWVVD